MAHVNEKNLHKFLQDEGQRTISIFMLHENQLKWAVSNDLKKYFETLISFYNDLLENKNYTYKEVEQSEAIVETHERLINTYEELKLDFKKKDFKIVYENGTLSQVLDRNKLCNSSVWWIGEGQ